MSADFDFIKWVWGLYFAPIGFALLKIFSINSRISVNEANIENLKEQKKQVWENIKCIRKDVSEIKEDMSYLRGKFDNYWEGKQCP